ncbi:MAG: radical SAM protein [Planctomycetota bacterium]|nr:radical SAM protein [Planctomycetota bacterium]
MPADLRIASVGPHFGEEAPLVGRGGSGTIFLAGCNLLCAFCQNWEISHGAAGAASTVVQLVRLMLALQEAGCHNINFVTPTHYLPQIAAAIVAARQRGLRIPIVYNCGGYEKVEALRLLAGLIEIYMPDFKFMDSAAAARYLQAPDYPQVARAALREMQRQVGDLVIANGLAQRGLLVRHLIMPGMTADSMAIVDFLADLSPRLYLNAMGQYWPCHRAAHYPEINRRPTPEEIAAVRRYAAQKGLRLDER